VTETSGVGHAAGRKTKDDGPQTGSQMIVVNFGLISFHAV